MELLQPFPQYLVFASITADYHLTRKSCACIYACIVHALMHVIVHVPYLLVYKSTFYDKKISQKNRPRLIHESYTKT